MENKEVNASENSRLESVQSQQKNSPGAILAEQRKLAGLTVENVAARLKITVQQINNIEADNYEALKGIVFARGFVRAYARALKIDPEPLVAWFADKVPSVKKVKIQPKAQGAESFEENDIVFRKKKGGFVGKLLLLLIVIAIALVVVWNMKLIGPKTKSDPVIAKPAVTQPVVSPTTEQQSSVASAQSQPESVVSPTKEEQAKTSSVASEVKSGTLVLNFIDKSWVKVQRKDNSTITQFEGKPGEQKAIDTGNEPVTVILGYAPGLKMTYKGQVVDLSSYRSVARISLK